MPLTSNAPRDIEIYVDEQMAAPVRLPSFTSAMLPSRQPRRLAFDETTGKPAYSDATGARNDLSPNPSAFSGTYTPTLTNVANLDGSGAFQCQYMRVGSVVTVSGKVTVDPTAPASSTQLGISLPIASDITAAEGCAGTAYASGIAAQGAAILGDATNNRAQLQFISADLTSQAMYFSFSYLVT